MEQVKEFCSRLFYKTDPRYIVILNHVILLSTAILFFGLRRTWDQMTFAVVVAIATEIILSAITLKQKTFDIKSRVLSSLVLALSTLLLVRSSYWWFYGFIAFVGVASKYILLNDKGRHIYNPTNVAIVFAIIVLPEFMFVRPDSFSTHIFSLACILCFGTMAVIRADSWRMTLSYFLGIVALGSTFIDDNRLPILINYWTRTECWRHFICFLNDDRSANIAT